ncbi:ribosome maturation factor RimM [Comamonas sp. 17RB]|uniref:ribosome maturation factor RimM n=1 Tax=Comamonas sp. 17RB TaxID=3047025 RepID=UPI0024B6D139|nr:ribosome maturation factor RimM [Comamonas sp. 17RB]MDI9857119.1 ribosome maturation factor RimM [Comamonas sp. 17RB]
MSQMPELEVTTLPADAVEVGRIADAWGIKGWFKVISYSSDAEVLLTAKNWYLLPAEKGAKHFTGTVLLPVKQARTHSDSIVATAAAVGDRNAAETLRGARIFVSRTAFPAPDEGEFYWVDLLGMSVVNREGVAMGVVKDLLATGPQTTLVLAYDEGGKERERMIPFVDAYVDKVDLAGKSILVDWQLDY